MDLALFSDQNMLAGLHVTLHSCLEHWEAESPLNIHLFHSDLSPEMLSRLEATLALAKTPFTFQHYAFDSESLHELKAFHGNRMVYGRILLPDLLPHLSRVVYLDCDVIVNLSLHGLLTAGDGIFSKPVAAVSTSTFGWSLDRNLCSEAGIDFDAPYFNSGVLLLNLDLWRAGNFTEKCLDFAKRHSLHDQSALNFVFSKNFHPLPRQFNYQVYPSSPKLLCPEEKIIHFLGAPKPFDFLGGLLNRNSSLFTAALRKTAYIQPGWSAGQAARTLKLAGSYLRTCFLHFKSTK